MKTLTKLSFFILAVFFAATTALAQSDLTADQIVAKNIEAVGGRDVINNIKSVVIEATIEVNGNEGSDTITILNGKGFKSSGDFQGTKIVNVVTPTAGWDINPYIGHTTPTATPDEGVKQSQTQLHIGGQLMNYSADGGKIELAGKDTADYKIRLTNSLGTDATYYINMKTFLLDAVTTTRDMGGQQLEITVRYSDYRKLDNGATMAYQQATEFPQYTMNMTYKKVDFNKEIDPSIFDMPK